MADGRAIDTLMERCGTRLSTRDFIRSVSNAYHAVQAPEYDRLHGLIRNQVPPLLAKLLCQADFPSPGLSILEVGSGTGLASQTLVQWAGPRLRHLLCSDISPEMLALCRKKLGNSPAVAFALKDAAALAEDAVTYDLVVTCSVVHHIASLLEFFRNIDALIRPGGYYLMLHEPSARFYANPECLELSNRYRRTIDRWKVFRYCNPAAYSRKIGAIVGGRSRPFHERVNKLLIDGGVTRWPLTMQELGQLVDVHDPAVEPESLGMGQRGFRVEEITAAFPLKFELVAFETYGFLGDFDNTAAPRKWRKSAEQIAARCPMDGANFCALWRKSDRGR